MTKTYNVVVVEVGDNVEEEVVLLVAGTLVKCFVNYCPEGIVVGDSYEVEFSINFPDGDYVILSGEEKAAVESIGSGFSCFVYGYLDGSIFRSFIDFPDQEIHYEYPGLNEKYIKVKVERINVNF